MISHSKRFLFVHVPKTGGNSVQSVLAAHSEDRLYIKDPKTQDGVDRFAVTDAEGHGLTKHARLIDYQTAYGDRIAGYFTFATIRNPFDRLVSHFFSPHRGAVEFTPEAFRIFIDHQPPTQHYLANASGEVRLDRLLRFEHLAEDLHEVCARLGIATPDIPHLNKSSRPSYRACYTDDAIALIQQKHALELELGEYRF